MRLLCANANGAVSLVKVDSDQTPPPYAILSHTWGLEADELSFKDLSGDTIQTSARNTAGYKKLQFCQQQAASDGLSHFWIDTCCIDKSSSQEVSEAINSMFRWYKYSSKCYVYLTDVSASNAHNDHSDRDSWIDAFQQSRWFSRGWTLQELLAPKEVEFFSREGLKFGNKVSLDHIISRITKIPKDALLGRSLSEFGIEERLSWAKRRRTKREEDSAYCLLGIFDITMPLVYTEGRAKAFRRLCREIDMAHEHLASSYRRKFIDANDTQLPKVKSLEQNADQSTLTTEAQKVLERVNEVDDFQLSNGPIVQEPLILTTTRPLSDNFSDAFRSEVKLQWHGSTTPALTAQLEGIISGEISRENHVSSTSTNSNRCILGSFVAPPDVLFDSIFHSFRIPANGLSNSLWSQSLIPCKEAPTTAKIVLTALANNVNLRDSVPCSGAVEMLKGQMDSGIPLAKWVGALEEPLKSTLVERLFPLSIEARNSAVVQMFLSFGADPNQALLGQFPSFTALGRAAFLGDFDTVRVLLHANAKIEMTPYGHPSDCEPYGGENALAQMLRLLDTESSPGTQRRGIRVGTEFEPISSENLRIVSVLIGAGAKVSSMTMKFALQRRDLRLVHYLASRSRGPVDSWVTGDNLQRLMLVFSDEEVYQVLHTIDNAPSLHACFWRPVEDYETKKSRSYIVTSYLGSSIIFSGSVLDLAAFYGHSKTMDFLTKQELATSTSTLIYAILGKSKSIVRKLLQQGVDCKSAVGLRWQEGLVSGRCTTQIIDPPDFFNYNYETNITSITPFCASVLAGDTDIFTWVSERGATYDCLDDSRFYPAITAACATGQRNLVDQLLESKSDIDGLRLTKAMVEACSIGHFEIAMKLLKYQPDVVKSFNGSDSALLEAVKQRNYDLTMACLNSLRLETWFSPFPDSLIDSLWMSAIEWEQYDVMEYLRALSPSYSRHIVYALHCRNMRLFRRFVETDENLILCHRHSLQCSDSDHKDVVDGEKIACCPLSAALRYSVREAIGILLSLSCDPDCPEVWVHAARDRDLLERLSEEYKRRNGRRKTTHATWGLLVTIMKQLEDQAALLTEICNVNYPVQLTWLEPLLLKRRGLRRNGRSVDGIKEGDDEEADDEQRSVKQDVEEQDRIIDPEDVAQLHGKALPFVQQPKYKITPFGYAILRDETEGYCLIHLLLKAGGWLEHVATSTRELPLHLAISTGQIEKVRLLIDAGAKVNSLAERGISRTSLQAAAEIGSYEIVELLLKQGADLNASPAFYGGATALQLAAIQGFMGIVELLLDHGADINTQAGDVNGRTALEGAAEHGRVIMVQYLLKQGVDIRGESGAGQLERAISFARKQKHLGLCDYLKSLRYPMFKLE